MTDTPHILVTGSTRGIGAAIAEALAAKSVSFVGHGRYRRTATARSSAALTWLRGGRRLTRCGTPRWRGWTGVSTC